LSKSGIRLSAKPDRAALEPGSAGSKQLVGRSILYHWTDVGWVLGVVHSVNGDTSTMIDGDMVNFMVYYEWDDDHSRHVLKPDAYHLDGPANSWVLLEEPVAKPEAPPVAKPDTPPVRDDALAGTPHFCAPRPWAIRWRHPDSFVDSLVDSDCVALRRRSFQRC
jgi:hypothetical protein